MFKTRLLSGIVLVILLLIFLITGGEVLLAALGLVSLIGLFELFKALKMQKSPVAIVGYLATLVFYVSHLIPGFSDNFALLIVYLIVLMVVFVVCYPKVSTTDFMAAFFGFVYVSVMLSYVYQLRAIPEKGVYLVFLIFLCSWGCDTCAYCVGKLIGKHKMSPVLSPKKSVEGAIGGVVGTGLLTGIYAFVIFKSYTVVIGLVIISMVAAVVSMFGDLTASAIKRFFDIKDYGKLIPGHGGILDRFDSVIIVAPIIYYLIYYFLV